jgi:hypothetical protein
MAGTRIAAAGFGDRVDIFEGDATAPVFAEPRSKPLCRCRSSSTSPSRTLHSISGRVERASARPYVPRSLAPRLRAAGFEVREIRIVPILNTEYTATTFSYNIAPLIAAFEPGAT